MPTDEDGQLFPAADYDDPTLHLEGPQGERIDAIQISIGGGIDLDRLDQEHVGFVRDSTLGRGVRITILCQVDRETTKHQRRSERTDVVRQVSLGASKIVDWQFDEQPTKTDPQEVVA